MRRVRARWWAARRWRSSCPAPPSKWPARWPESTSSDAVWVVRPKRSRPKKARMISRRDARQSVTYSVAAGRGMCMTYCVGVLLNEGIVLASDSRTHAGVDNFATFCKMTVFERPDDRVVGLLSSGSLAGTQAVISILKQQGESSEPTARSIWSARTMFDVAVLVSDAVRDIE